MNMSMATRFLCAHHECAIGKVEELQLRVANLDQCLRASLAREAELENERDEREASRVSWDTLRKRPNREEVE